MEGAIKLFNEHLVYTVTSYLFYVEGYENTEQKEIQSVYFGHETFSLRGEDGELINENISIVSEDNDHSRINTYTCTKKVITLFLLYQVNNT